MFRFQYEVRCEKSFHYRDFQVFCNVQGFIMFRLFLHYGWDRDFWIFPWIQSKRICFTTIFVACSLYSYKYIDSQLETAYEQATITAFIWKILLGRVSCAKADTIANV